MPRGKLFALAFAGFLLGAVAVPAGAAEVGANPAPDYAAMMRAHMERQRALTELFTAQIKQSIDALAATPAFQQSYTAYLARGGRLSFQQYGLAHLASNGFAGGIDPDRAYLLAIQPPTWYDPGRPPRHIDGRQSGYHALGAPVDAGAMTQLVLPDGRPVSLPPIPASILYHDPATAQVYARTSDDRYFVWMPDGNWAELRRPN
ncbi:MAG: hypothetical protein ACRCVA_15060 [Phreatobacter sp.]